MAHQEALTLIAKVKRADFGALEAIMNQLAADPAGNDIAPFAAIEGLHFGRFLLLPAAEDLQGKPLEPQLLLITDCDGAASQHLEHLVATWGEGIDRIFEHCQDYPAAPCTPAQRLAYLRRVQVEVPANYVHRPGRTVRQIRDEAKLRRDIGLFVDQEREALSHLSALEVRQRIIAFVRDRSDLAWALQRPEGVGSVQRLQDSIDLVARPAAVALTAPVLFPALSTLMALIRLEEARERPPHLRPSAAHVQALTQLEDFNAHNGFSAGGFVKPGLVRHVVLKAVLELIGWGTRHLFTRDSLAGVKSIHFARWIPIDDGRRVIFCSNYDGSLESYNNDFIDLVAWGLNLVFSNGVGYPPTRWLIHGGARYEQHFKDHLRRHQIPTPVWYSAYPELKALNIEHAAALRAGLSGNMNEAEAGQWLRWI